GDPNNILLFRYISLADGETELLNDSMTATASSSFFGESGDELLYNPQNVLDPIDDEGWATASGSTYPQWWQVDVGEGETITPTSIWLTPQTVARSPSGFTVSYSDDGETFTTYKTFESTTGWTAE